MTLAGTGIRAQETEPGQWHALKELDFHPDSSFFHLHPFFGPEGFFDRYNEWMEKFRQEFSFPDDSSHYFYPRWQQLPRHRKKFAVGIEI